MVAARLRASRCPSKPKLLVVTAIEARDTIEIMRRVLPREAIPELLTTVRQASKRSREITGLFREARTAEALAMKREDGTARLIGGAQDKVVQRIADFYIERRDTLRASRAKRRVTVSALTNEEAADISRAIRTRMKEHRELGPEERSLASVDQRDVT